MSVVIDPVGSGLVSSLARPGENVTGLSLMAPDLIGKNLEVLRELVPKGSRIAALWNPDNPGSAAQLREANTERGPGGFSFELSRRGLPPRSTAPSPRWRVSARPRSWFCLTPFS